jgi:REP element-mobilizing transposase RayT
MARVARIEYPNALYHVTSRGNWGRDIFLDRDDRRIFLCLLNIAVGAHAAEIFAYCLMTNHIHLLVRTPEANLSKFMHHLNSGYASCFNMKHDLDGHVLQGRYFARLVERDAYLHEAARYIMLNPSRAGIVDHPSQWPYSSYRATAGFEAPPDFLRHTALLDYFGSDIETARINFLVFVEHGIGRELDLELICTGRKTPSLEKLFASKPRNEAIRSAVRDWHYQGRVVARFLGISDCRVSQILRESNALKNSV